MKILDHTSQRSTLRQPVALIAFGIVAVMAAGLAGCGSSSDSRQRIVNLLLPILRVPMAARVLLEILAQVAELCLLPQKLKVIRVPTTT